MRNKRKILLISVMPNWGGGEQFILDLCKNISFIEFKILSASGEPLKIFKQHGLNVREIKSLKKLERSNQQWTRLTILQIIYNLILNSFYLLKEIKGNKYDLVILNGNMAGLYAYIPLRITRIKNIVIQHLIYKNPTFELKVVNLLLKNANQFVCVSEAVAENIMRFIKAKELIQKIKVIHNGTYLSRGTEDIFERSGEYINLGFVGSIKKEKGLDIIIEALRLIPPELNYSFHVFGSFGMDKESAKYKEIVLDKIQRYHLENKVIIHDFIEDKNKIYRQIDVLINYSISPEALPFVIVEGMSYGKILIASNEGGPKEIITHNVNGFLVEPRNPQKLSETIIECIAKFSSEEFNTIRFNAFNMVKEKYSMERFTSDYENLFDSIFRNSNDTVSK